MNLAYPPLQSGRRHGLLLTAAVHVALVLGWMAARPPPAPQPTPDDSQRRILWMPLAPAKPAARTRDREPPAPVAAAAPRPLARPTLSLPPLPVVTPAPAPADGVAVQTPVPAAAGDAASPQRAPQAPSAAQILQQARRDIGSIAKALRKENNPYIAAPLDSPQLRMQRGMEQAAALARPGLFEAPKIEELVNNTGDGARRTRVISGGGTYCVTARSPAAGIDVIEKQGKQLITSCPKHEEPPKQQSWRTLRD